MKFSKPINREIDIDGNTFIVSFDDNGIDFRLKGKRRTAHVDWIQVFNIAQGEQGANARDFLGVGSGQSQQQEGDEAERVGQTFQPQASATAGHQTTGAQAQASRANQPLETESTSREELGRAVTAGEVGPES
ncbi:MAG TPA: hypothetical protein VNI02_07945 [Blastocatellia bacterium]|jgi:hypothetical protein|nr:hypothetical protein [Blastocatellia bacterium]